MTSPNAVKADNEIYHKGCEPEDASNKAAIVVSEDEVCANCGAEISAGPVQDQDVEDDEHEDEDREQEEHEQRNPQVIERRADEPNDFNRALRPPQS